MRQIRFGVFETNSSSTHAVTILTDEEYNAYCKGDLLIDKYSGEIAWKDDLEKEAKEFAEKQVIERYDTPVENNWLRDYYTREDYYKDCYNEMVYDYKNDESEINEAHRNINGTLVHAISIYGYDG